MRSITKLAGVTEAALYRHYRSKDHLYLEACADIVTRMIDQKRALAAQPGPASAKVREWVRVTYEFFDASPEAFACVLLRDDRPAVKLEPIDGAQSGLFEDVFRAGVEAGEFRDMPVDLATALFSGAMLQVPRLIVAGEFRGPASAQWQEVAERLLAMLAAAPKGAGPRGDAHS